MSTRGIDETFEVNEDIGDWRRWNNDGRNL